ncbi:hypothetical protein Tco_1433384, partial [Tanacetum coccineum]
MGSKIMASGEDCLDGEGEVKVESMGGCVVLGVGPSDVTWSDVTRDKVRSKVMEFTLEWSIVYLKRFSE